MYGNISVHTALSPSAGTAHLRFFYWNPEGDSLAKDTSPGVVGICMCLVQPYVYVFGYRHVYVS